MMCGFLRGGVALALSLIVSACAVAGPDYHLPEKSVALAPAAAAPFSGAEVGVAVNAPLPDKWWRLYNDPRLDALVQEALNANADLRVADANLRRAAALVRQAQAGRDISTTISGGGTLDRKEETGYSLPGILGYDAGISASLPIDLSGRIARGIEAARADEEAAQAARDDVRVTVAAAVTRAYASVCAANFSLATNQRVVDLQRQTVVATRRLQQGGRGTAFDVTRAEAAVEQSEAALPAFIAQRQENLFLIATLLGRVPADYPKDSANCVTIPQLATPLPVGDGAALLKRRPDIRAAERALAADTARLGVTMADLYPQVSLGGSIGLGGPFKDIGGGDSIGFNLGPLISWSFPNRPVVKARIAAAGAQVEADAARFDTTVLDALRETETALNRYARNRDQSAAFARARDSSAQASEQAGKLFRFGRGDFLSLLDTQRSFASAEATLAAAQVQLVQDQIAIFLALGGGWQGSGVDVPAPIP